MAKRIISILVSILLIIATIGVVIFVLNKTGIINKDKLDKVEVHTYEDENGYTYTEREWSWKPAESRKVINYIDMNNAETQTIALHLEDTTFYNITVPTGNVIYDYGKTVWAEDGSYLIRVIGDVTLDTLSKAAGIDKGIALDQTTLSSPDDVKGARTLCTLIDDTAIIVNVYSGNETYSIIRDSLTSNKDVIYINEVEYSNTYTELTKVNYTGQYIPQVHFSEFDLSWLQYLFADGQLSVYTKYDKMHNIEDTLLAQLNVFSQSAIDETFRTDSMLYAKAGDWYLGLFKYNTNTTVVLFGSGEEAKCNIVALLDSIK